MTRDSPTFAEIWPTLADRIGGRPVVAHNDGAVAWRGPPLSRYDAVIMAAAVTAEIERLVDLIVAEAHPLRVILFGSSARGDTTPDSDIDLLVVVADSPLPAHKRAQAAYRSLRGLGTPCDVIVQTRAETERLDQVKTSLTHLVLERGRLIHG